MSNHNQEPIYHPGFDAGDGSSHDGLLPVVFPYYRWVAVQGGHERSRRLIDNRTGETLGVVCCLPLLGVWTGRLLLPGHETRSCTRQSQHQARAWVVSNVRLHRRVCH